MSQILLVKGAAYRAQIKIPWYASTGMAKGRLESAGFISVNVYEVDGKTYAQGVWDGATGLQDIPEGVVPGTVTKV